MQDGLAFTRVAQIVRDKQPASLILIASAMSGVTDALIASFRSVATHGVNASLALLEQHFARHVEAAACLDGRRSAKLDAAVASSRREIIDLLQQATNGGATSLRIQDAVASYGERLSASLLTLILKQHGIPAEYVDARRCILTNDDHGNAQPLFTEVTRRTNAELLPLLAKKRVPVLGGFIGATVCGVTTTLGRGSSDYSATLIGAAVHAGAIEIWTDVNGIQTADPRLVKTARTVPHLSYEEAAQLANLGARVMHPKMIEPVREIGIPIRIKNSHAPEQFGTLISAEPIEGNGAVKAIAHKIELARERAVVGCVGDGVRARSLLSSLDPCLHWHSNSPNNVVALVRPDEVESVVRRLHAAIFE